MGSNMTQVKKAKNYLNKKSEIDDGVPIEIITGGLHSPFPIPAYHVLIEANEHVAKDVLTCFVSHLGYGKSSNCVWPSISLIAKESRHSRQAVVRGHRVLKEFGFIKVGKYKSKNGWANRYYFQAACYHSFLMNEKAVSYTKVFGQCEACNKIVRDAEVGSGLDAYVHYGCGGNVRKLARIKRELYKPDIEIHQDLDTRDE
jgi:hypothetical protein